MKRKAYNELLFWKNHKTKQALLVTGARQVGKTYLIREFGKNEYEHFVEFNLLLDDRSRESFSNASSSKDLLLRISVAASEQLVEFRTLIFIDEVQASPQVMTMVKGLVEDGRFDFILSGSLLGVELKNVRSLPVGYLSEVRMHPLDFEEFCWASGLTKDAFAILRDGLAKSEEIPGFLHERFLDLFHRYLLVGGMPDVVVAFLRDGTIDQPRRAQLDIRRLYEADISKYAPESHRLVIREIYRLIPSQLQSQNRRFTISSIQDVKRFDQVQDDFSGLPMRMSLYPCITFESQRIP